MVYAVVKMIWARLGAWIIVLATGSGVEAG